MEDGAIDAARLQDDMTHSERSDGSLHTWTVNFHSTIRKFLNIIEDFT